MSASGQSLLDELDDKFGQRFANGPGSMAKLKEQAQIEIINPVTISLKIEKEDMT